MINKLKIGLLIAVLSLVLGVGRAHAVSDLTFSSDTVVTVNGNDYTILAGSEATSVAVSATQLVVVMPTTKTFTLTNSSGFTLANDQSVTETCVGVVGTIAYTSSGTTTLTVTPTTVVACALPGGGGGGGRPITTITTAPVAGAVLCPAGVMYEASTGKRCTATSTLSASATSNNGVTSYDFGTVTLKNGSRGQGVQELQKFLNRFLNLGLVIDGKLGPKTIAVIKKWQKDNGLVSDGLIGKKTMAKMNASVK